MAKSTNIAVLITEGTHKTQPYTFRIVEQGPDMKAQERYTKLRAARKGAERKVRKHYPHIKRIYFTLIKGKKSRSLEPKFL